MSTDNNFLTTRSTRGQEALERYARREGQSHELKKAPEQVAADLVADVLASLPSSASTDRALRLAHSFYDAERRDGDPEWPTAIEASNTKATAKAGSADE